MKAKNYLMAFAAIAAMSSCSQQEEFINGKSPSSPDENAVTFSTYLGQALQTRATLIDTEELKKANVGFGVFAYLTGTEDFSEGSIPDFMYNQQVTWDKDNNIWTYTPLKYWPNEDDHKISFFAYAPYQSPEEVAEGENIISIPSNNVAGTPMIGFRLNSDYKKQIDLLYNGTPAINLIKPSIDTKVEFKFKHALSRVGFKAIIIVDEVADKEDGSSSGDGSNHKPILLDENSTVTINSITFKSTNFSTSGNLNLKTGEWDIQNSGEMTFDFDDDDFINGSNIFKGSESTVADENDTDKNTSKENSRVQKLTNEYLMLIPNRINEGNEIERAKVDLIVNYTIETKDEKLANEKISFDEVIEAPFEFEFKKGEAYDFVIHIGLTSVKLDASVNDWGNTNTEISANRTVYESTNYLGTFQMFLHNGQEELAVFLNDKPTNEAYRAKVMYKNANGQLTYTIPVFNNMTAKYYGSNCIFLGWSTKRHDVVDSEGDVSGDLYQPGDNVQILSEEELDNFELYAVWMTRGTD